MSKERDALQDFEVSVIQRSFDIPVLVEFWATGSDRNRSQGPAFERIVSERAGQLELVRVNTEAEPRLGVRLEIRSIPSVRFYREGTLVDEFEGAMSESDIREFIERNQLENSIDRLEAEENLIVRKLTETMLHRAFYFVSVPFALMLLTCLFAFRDLRILPSTINVFLTSALLFIGFKRMRRRNDNRVVFVIVMFVMFHAVVIALTLKYSYFAGILTAFAALQLGNVILSERQIVVCSVPLIIGLFVSQILHYTGAVVPFPFPDWLVLTFRISLILLMVPLCVFLFTISMRLGSERVRRTLAVQSTQSQLLDRIDKLSQRVQEVLRALNTSTADGASILSEQSISLTQIGVTCFELEQTSKRNQSLAGEVLNGSEKSESVSQAGESTKARSVESMAKIHDEQQRIANTIKSFFEIGKRINEFLADLGELAGKTKILSVNASVEAAKAGSYGHGFGVVAQEVRVLSEQSRKTAKKIGAVVSSLDQSLAEVVAIVERGNAEIDQSLDQLKQLGNFIERLAGVAREGSRSARQIANATVEQSTALIQITDAIQQIDGAMNRAKENAELVGGSLKQLNYVADELTEMLALRHSVVRGQLVHQDSPESPA